MEMKLQVPFQQLLTLVKGLTPAQKALLRQELTEGPPLHQGKDEFMKYLLNGPVYSKKDIKIIEENRKSISHILKV